MKPTVFFSHSSLDKEPIGKIKERLRQITGNSIDIFVSSDGESIPFGTNWLKEIEDSLNKCKLMFVWVTPNSLQSKWIYFESGFAYSKKIHLVPIGFLGVNLDNIVGPLGFQQGFNVNSSKSLNNIIAIINDEFGFTFPLAFDDQFYDQMFHQLTVSNIEVLKYVNHLESPFPYQIKSGEDKIEINPNWIVDFQEELKKSKHSYSVMNGVIIGRGYKAISHYTETESKEAILSIDPLSINKVIDVLKISNSCAYGENFPNIFIDIIHNGYYDLPEDIYSISSRLEDTEVDFNTSLPNILFKFRNITFRIIETNANRLESSSFYSPRVRLIIDRNDIEVIPLIDLIDLFVNNNILVHSGTNI